MTPNIGQGANTAMEAAAGLANVLHAVTQDNNIPSAETIEQALTTATHKHRKRLDAIHMESRWITRLEACQGRLTTAFARYIAPHCGDLFALGVVRNSYNGEVLQFLPLTERAGKNWPELEWWNTWGLSKWRDVSLKMGYLFFLLIVIVFINRVSGIPEL
jgi:FAD dependent monooxygenase